MAKQQQKGQRQEERRPNQNSGSNQGNPGVKLAIRQLGEGGISKGELKSIVNNTGVSAEKVIQRMDQVNQNLKSKDMAGIGLNSGAANMLIRQADKQSPTGYEAYKNIISSVPQYGTGRIGKTLQGMINAKGQPGAVSKAGSQLMIGGTQIRSGGNVAVKGFGKQYSGGQGGGLTWNGKPIQDGVTYQLNDAGTAVTGIAEPNNTNTSASVPESYTDPITDQLPTDTPTSETPQGPGSMSGGGSGAGGATGLRRAKGRLRQLGIYGRGTSLLGRGLQYGNTLNQR